MFDSPSAPGSGITWADHQGALLVFDVIKQEHGVETVHGTSDPVRADIYVVAGPGAGARYDDTLVFPLVLIGQLRRKVGKRVLGRLGQGTAEKGKSAPWELKDFTPEDAKAAEDYMRRLSEPAFASPTDKPPF